MTNQTGQSVSKTRRKRQYRWLRRGQTPVALAMVISILATGLLQFSQLRSNGSQFERTLRESRMTSQRQETREALTMLTVEITKALRVTDDMGISIRSVFNLRQNGWTDTEIFQHFLDDFSPAPVALRDALDGIEVASARVQLGTDVLDVCLSQFVKAIPLLVDDLTVVGIRVTDLKQSWKRYDWESLRKTVSDTDVLFDEEFERLIEQSRKFLTQDESESLCSSNFLWDYLARSGDYWQSSRVSST